MIVLCRAASGVADDAHAVCIIDDEAGLVFLFQRKKGRQRTDVSVHGKNTIGHDEALAFAGRLGQKPCQILHIGVRIDDDPCF